MAQSYLTTPALFNLNAIHSSWQSCIKTALTKMDQTYLHELQENPDWLPGREHLFNAFSLPLNDVHYVLFGESPYPRATSANGYAFWDAAVGEIWSETGLSKAVNRATSLRNMIKMLLIANNHLNPNNTSQEAIAAIDKKNLVKTNHEFFSNFLKHGFLLLNATLVLQPTQVHKDAKAWLPFMRHVLDFLISQRPHVEVILLGNIANTIDRLIESHPVKKIYAEHPYNISFIQNQTMIDFFRPFNLLERRTL